MPCRVCSATWGTQWGLQCSVGLQQCVQCSGRVQCPTRGGGSGDFHVPNVPHVPTGFERVQSFRKSDGSYGAWLHRGSSTW